VGNGFVVRCFGIRENMNENEKGKKKVLVEHLASQSLKHYKKEEPRLVCNVQNEKLQFSSLSF